MMRNHFILLVLVSLLSLQPLWAQSIRDSVLLNERSIDRPINLHGGQFRITTGYGLTSVTKRYDLNGNGINLRDEGISYVRHAIPISIRYGLSEYIEIGISSMYKRQTQREEELLTSAGVVFTNLFQVYERNGFEDVIISLSGRAPFRTRKIDLLLNVGVQLPVGSGKEDKPEHSLTQQNVSASVLRNIVYLNKPKWGNGVIVANAGGTVKARTPFYAFTLAVDYSLPLDESENTQWRHQLVGNQFEYQGIPFRYLNAERLSYFAEIERQLATWFNLSFQVLGEKRAGGWTEINGMKIIRPESSQLNVSPGFEILITPKVWLRQRLLFTLSGENDENLFAFNAALIYNFFP